MEYTVFSLAYYSQRLQVTNASTFQYIVFPCYFLHHLLFVSLLHICTIYVYVVNVLVGGWLVGWLAQRTTALTTYLLYLLRTNNTALLGSFFFLYEVDRKGRRFLLITGCVGMGVAWSGAVACTLLGGLEVSSSTVLGRAVRRVG